ncbi:CRISPR-associated endonuclease Cas2 [Candidatus Kaiserbacteria bacterium RIFCSPLOWO2_01_FULL_53_17]|uniref:CRISPR-associated endonuclease Cas2 n=1 Tax=Candidatus Kaiserbacteria bacterium RIFCSPLOWO2_01_FULL_53_17 TaxID=1798511 RepID=A0A1F6EG01_9BACT|nr:MAG: CRISPR-associated endonuclease Cas2 [Candidatus Kaiserbacteria bacterium RIFCSPLOWO2_01_FULL_53_17]
MVQKTTHKGYLFDDTPRGILEALAVVGGVTLALSVSPTLFVALAAIGYVFRAEDRSRRKKLQAAFQYLTRKRYVRRRTQGKKVVFELTKRGHAHIIHHLDRRSLAAPIERPATWDGRWRLILFDIPAEERTKRNAFRSFIRQIGAIMLQKSVWVYPFDCSERIDLLRRVFDLSHTELRLVIATSIGADASVRTHFDLKE